MLKRGRPCKVDTDIVIKAILKYKNRILLPQNKVVSKLDDVWLDISKELDYNKNAGSIYSFVCDNKFGIRDLLNGKEIDHSINDATNYVQSESSDSEKTESSDMTVENEFNASKDAGLLNVIKRTFTLKKEIFNKLVKEKKQRNKRICKKLEAGKWEDIVTEQIWNVTKLSCGFQFKDHYINDDESSGTINGRCKCGCIIRIRLRGLENCVEFHCTIQLGKGSCGKRYLRQPKRQKAGQILMTTSAERYRAELANNLMSEGDAEPPHLPKASVLNVAKKDYIQSLYLDKDPVVAIAKLQMQDNGQSIQFIGYSPFFCIYTTHFQRNVYLKYVREDCPVLYIDSSGNFASKLIKLDGTRGKEILLYIAVINCRTGQFSVTQLLSEAQDTGTILFWLMQWVRTGVPPPKETVTDCSRALLTAIIKAFTGHLSIEAYADCLFKNDCVMPKCYVRIDIAHFIKIYAIFLRAAKSARLVRKFYLSIIGKLALCTELSEARQIIKGVLVVSQSETDGHLINDVSTKCFAERSKQFLLKIITTPSPNNAIIEDIENNFSGTNETDENYPEELSVSVETSWSQWGMQINAEALQDMDVGHDINPYFLPDFAKKLLTHIKHLPLWSCICRDKFGHGRIPASSASVEGEFNKLKKVVFSRGDREKRIDLFIEDHLKYINGKMKIAEANFDNTATNNHDNTSDNEVNFSAIESEIQDTNENLQISTSELRPTTVENETNEIQNNNTIDVPITRESTKCPACLNGHSPPGGHQCFICGKPVHALEECSISLPDSEEGHGQKRICFECHTKQNGAHIVEAMENEKWGPKRKNKKKQRKATYLRNEEHMLNAFSFPKHTKLPIIKNGSLMSLHPVCIKSKQYTVQLTCALDSIMQIMLFSLTEFKDISENFASTDSLFFKIISDIRKNGIRAETYKMRTELYLDLFINYTRDIENRSKEFNDSILLDCSTDAAYLLQVLFKDHPSYTEVSKCRGDCQPRRKKRVLIALSYEEMNSVNFNDILLHKLRIEDNICAEQPKCVEVETTTIDETVLVHGDEEGNSNFDYPNNYDYDEYDDPTNGTFNEITSTTHRPPDRTDGAESINGLRFTRPLVNVTKEAGDSIRLRCEAGGGARRIRWLKNEAPVVEERGRVAIRSYVPGIGESKPGKSHGRGISSSLREDGKSTHSHRDTGNDMESQGEDGPSPAPSSPPEAPPIGSRLRISPLETHDMGFYTCVASDGKNTISSTAVLYVNMNRFGHMGAPATIPNFAPVFPNFPALGGNIPNAGSSGLLPAPPLSPQHSPILPMSPIDIPHIDRGTGGDARGGSSGGYCQMYQGSMCSQVVGNRSIYVPASVTQEIIEQKVQRAITVIAPSSDLTKRCEAFAIPSVCYTAFPLCENEEGPKQPPPGSGSPSTPVFLDGKPFNPSTNSFFSPSSFPAPIPPGTYPGRPRYLCREECEVLEADVCRVEYAIAKRHPLIGQSLGLPDCTSLPPIESPAAKTCLRLGIPDVRSLIIHDDDCYTDRGETYRGPVSKSSSGRPCLQWSNLATTAPSIGEDPSNILRLLQEKLLPAYSVELSGGHSYCRNPGAAQARPWCFVEEDAESDWGSEKMKKRIRMEFCDIPQCTDHRWIYIIATSIGISLLFLLWLVIFCVRRGRRGGGGSGGSGTGGRIHEQVVSANSPTIKQPVPPGVKVNGASALEMNALLPKGGGMMGCGGGENGTTMRAQEYPLSSVRFLQELGEGAFGKVYKGEVWCSETESPMSVAVKALKENASPKTVSDFRREVDLMSELRHPNIVCLVGVVSRGEPLCMLFEYMAQGDLHEFLMTHSPRSESEGVLAGNMEGGAKPHILGQYELLHIATQIAAGMEYLSAQHYVHRDLAARNCLVGDGLRVKISDFGLSRDVYSSDYYRVQSKSLLPVRWMPTESILYGKFTTDSDVWSFGVLLWEVYTYGLQPYYGYSNQEVIEMIRSRQLLPRPEDCPPHIYGLMQDCWHQVPPRRPPFPLLHATLRSWLIQHQQPLQRCIATETPHVVGSSVASSSSSSQRSSTGPSNNTGSTRLSSSGKSANAIGAGHLGTQMVVRLPPPPANHIHQTGGKIANI